MNTEYKFLTGKIKDVEKELNQLEKTKYIAIWQLVPKSEDEIIILVQINGDKKI